VSVFAAILLAATSLQITIWPNGEDHTPKRTLTLRCAPLGGTLPQRASACRQLAKLKAPFAPVPKSVACTEIYGGPAQALVIGRFRGGLVRARFNLQNGCEIGRWLRLRFLLGAPATNGS
jgi:Subtilisin inhibitor-like